MSLAKLIYRQKDSNLGPFAGGVREAAKLLPDAGKFIVDQNVMDAVERMERRNSLKELFEKLHLAKLPFPTTWIEWSRPGGNILGYLITQPDANVPGFQFKHFFSFPNAPRETPIFCQFGWINVTQRGVTPENAGDAKSHRDDPAQLEIAVRDLLCLLMMMANRRPIVEIAEPVANDGLDANRAKRGRPPAPNLRPIRFDLDRFHRLGVTQPGAGQREAAEHFVRGHFKLRKSGLYWWSTHIRFRHEADSQAKPGVYHVMKTEDNEG